MDELEEIKKRRLLELQKQQEEAIEQEQLQHQQMQHQIEQLEVIVKQAMTKDALVRYGNLKIAHPDKAVQLLVVLAQALQQGKIKQINDSQLKEILIQLTPKKRETKITRK